MAVLSAITQRLAATLALFTLLAYGEPMDATKYFTGKQLTLANAIDNDDRSAVAYAVKQGAQVNQPGTDGLTPAMYAVARMKKTAFAALIDAGADITLKASDSNSALTLAVRLARSDPEWLRLVIESGKADPNSKMPDNAPLLEYFIATEFKEAIRYLVSKGANPNRLGTGERPLVINAAYAGRYEIVELLIQLGADPTINNQSGLDLATVARRRTMLDVAPGSPEWLARERVKKLLAEKSAK